MNTGLNTGAEPDYDVAVVGAGPVGMYLALRQAHITLSDVRLPADAVLPGARTFKDAARVLCATRAGVAWSALGHATAR